MIKILFRLLWVTIFLALFTLFGGGRLIKWVGEGIVDLSERVIGYEEEIKGKAANLWEGVEKKGEKIKKRFED